jgi:hypothetical protein
VKKFSGNDFTKKEDDLMTEDKKENCSLCGKDIVFDNVKQAKEQEILKKDGYEILCDDCYLAVLHE